MTHWRKTQHRKYPPDIVFSAILHMWLPLLLLAISVCALIVAMR
jgi:hypothetical protein